MKKFSRKFAALLVAGLALTSCVSQKPVIECRTGAETLRSEITVNELVRVDSAAVKTVVFGSVEENGKPVSGVIFFTEESTKQVVNEFISYANDVNGEFSVTLEPGTYAIRIVSDLYQYEIGTLKLQPGEVRRTDITLEGYSVYE